jgi:hypothetical protein
MTADRCPVFYPRGPNSNCRGFRSDPRAASREEPRLTWRLISAISSVSQKNLFSIGGGDTMSKAVRHVCFLVVVSHILTLSTGIQIATAKCGDFSVDVCDTNGGFLNKGSATVELPRAAPPTVAPSTCCAPCSGTVNINFDQTFHTNEMIAGLVRVEAKSTNLIAHQEVQNHTVTFAGVCTGRYVLRFFFGQNFSEVRDGPVRYYLGNRIYNEYITPSNGPGNIHNPNGPPEFR